MAAFFVSDVAALLRHASMSASYKPALLKALVRLCRRYDALEIPLDTIGDEFARMYWNQTIIYHLRQASALTKEAEVIKTIRAAANVHRARYYSDMPERGRSEIRRNMARILSINVLEAFHASRPPAMPRLYEWSKGQPFIRLSEPSRAFLKDQGAALEVLANYYWADFLESRNRLAPRVIQKVERDGPPRASLVPYLRLLTAEDEASCFYCGVAFHDAASFAVDHVIPRSFLMEDPLWDMVLACRACNSSKSDWLPEKSFIERLALRNATRLKALVGTKVSLLHGADDMMRLYEAAISLEWPGYWRP